jgi:hypothetical protein
MKKVQKKTKVWMLFVAISGLFLAFLSVLIFQSVSLMQSNGNSTIFEVVPFIPETVLGGVALMVGTVLAYLVWFEYGYEALMKIFHTKEITLSQLG